MGDFSMIEYIWSIIVYLHSLYIFSTIAKSVFGVDAEKHDMDKKGI